MSYQETEQLFEAEVKIERLEAQAAAMREALEAVMWASLESGEVYCQWCAVSEGEEHLPDCQGYNALSGDAGRPLLERLRNAEAELENGHKALDAAGVPETDEHDALFSIAGRVARLRQERDEAREDRDFYASPANWVGNVPRRGR